MGIVFLLHFFFGISGWAQTPTPTATAAPITLPPGTTFLNIKVPEATFKEKSEQQFKDYVQSSAEQANQNHDPGTSRSYLDNLPTDYDRKNAQLTIQNAFRIQIGADPSDTRSMGEIVKDKIIHFQTKSIVGGVKDDQHSSGW